ncbi:MAG: LCP family protein [Acidimicrobiales bacterium]|nr:LCP family protein [Acidimicrobiales bacterium]
MRSSPSRVRGRRTWPQRLLLAVNVALVLVALGAAALLGYGYEKAGRFPRMALSGVLAEVEASSGEGAMNVLLVGTDTAEGLDPDDPVLEGRPESNDLTDSIMILRIDPAANDAALLSIPRDLWVPIAGTDQSNKINTAYSVGGASALIETIDDYLGIPVNHFVAVDFAGFQQVVSAIGGVEVYFPHPARDQGSGLFVPEAGCQLLDPAQALAYSRARHYENRIDGRWVPDRQADFGRMQRQQEFMRRALSRAIDRGARNPVTLNALLNAVDGALVLDDQLTTGQIVDIASAFRLFNPEELNSYSLQGYVSDQMIRGQSALVLHEAEADPVLDLFRGEQGLDPTPETVRLRVLNGSGAPDQAWDVAESLRAAGFGVPMTDNLRGDTISRTEIRHHPGQRASAELLARYLVTSPRLVEDRSLSFVPIELVTGTDFRGVIEPDDQSDSEGSSGSGGTASTSTSSSSSTTTPSTAPPSTDDEAPADESSPPPRC